MKQNNDRPTEAKQQVKALLMDWADSKPCHAAEPMAADDSVPFDVRGFLSSLEPRTFLTPKAQERPAPNGRMEKSLHSSRFG